MSDAAAGPAGTVPVLVTGAGNLALGALRIFGRQGIPVWAAARHPGIERASRWYRPVPGEWTAPTLEENLRTCPLPRAVLIPTSDAGSIEAAGLPPDLSERFPSATPDAALMRAIVDKEGLAEILERHDIPRPRSWPAESPADLDAIGDDEIENVFLKPRDSGPFSGVYGKKSLRPQGRRALAEALAEALDRGFPMIAQEYIPGPASNCYLIDGFIDRHGEVKGTFARRRRRMYPLDFGNSSAVSSVARDEVAEAEAVLLPLLRAIGYRGIFNAEFKRDERDGGFRLFEINVRTWLYAEFASRCGFDAVVMAYHDALGLPIDWSGEYAAGRTIIYPYFDLAACMQLRRQGEMGLGDVARSWLGAEQLVYTRDDPRPFLVGSAELWKGFIERRLPWRRRS